MVLVPTNFFLARRLYSGGKSFDWANMIFPLILCWEVRHAYWFSVVFVSCQLYLLFDARAFSLTSSVMKSSSLWLNKGFSLLNFLQSASWIWMIISDFLFVCECDSFLQCFVPWIVIHRFKYQRIDCTLKWSYINYGELRCDLVMIALKAMIFKLWLVFLRIMQVFWLERVVSPLVPLLN